MKQLRSALVRVFRGLHLRQGFQVQQGAVEGFQPEKKVSGLIFFFPNNSGCHMDSSLQGRTQEGAVSK